MRLGDLFEWIAAAAFVTAGYLWLHSVALALLIFGVCLGYFAQCHATTELPRVRLPKVPRVRPIRKASEIICFMKASWKRKVGPNAPPRPR